MTPYPNQPIDPVLEMWENFNRDLQPQGCYHGEDLKDTMTREAFMDALHIQLLHMLPLQTGRQWHRHGTIKGGSWLCACPEGEILQITYREKTEGTPGKIKVAIRVSTAELNVLTNELVEEHYSPLYEWRGLYPMKTNVEEWCDVVDLSIFTRKENLGLKQGGRLPYPDSWAMPKGTMAMCWEYDDVIQPMTPKQVSWAARCIGQMAASLLYIKSVIRSGVTENPYDTWPWYTLRSHIYHDITRKGVPDLRDVHGPYYYDESHGDIRIHLHDHLLHNLKKSKVRRRR